MFRLTYYLTLISCTFALLKFLDVGPTRILEKDGWRNYAGYGISFISVIVVLQAKAQGLGTGGYVMTMLYDQLGIGNYVLIFNKYPILRPQFYFSK